MTVLADTDRAFWRDVLLTGGFSGVPRWTRRPVPGEGRLETALPDDVPAALGRVAGALGVPVSSLLLAAHARVLSALTGEREVVTGYVTGSDATPLPCRLATGASWRELVLTAAGAESALREHSPFPVDDLRRDLDVPTQFEAVVDPVGAAGDLPPGAVLGVALDRSGPWLLELRYRTDALDRIAAERVAGYHRAALVQLAADPDADPATQTLLSEDELAVQLDGLAGPRHELPDRRVHELFEARAAAHPDAVAAVHGDDRLTYGALDARANRLARALLARGVQREQIVAVVTERNLDWMTAVLAIWKAGAAYLPLEPHFPPGRIAAALARADCRLVLTEHGSTTTLDQALTGLPATGTLFLDAALAEDRPDGPLGVPVGADQLAYVLFTSGSTGEPKGVMCEHAGMLNHVYAKILDLGIGEGEVVPQTGPQCFDISVWQLVAALLVGGRSVIVDPDVILDAERLVDTLVESGAGVLQAVPSYLDVVLTYLEQHPRELPSLHCVSPTGDFLKKDLVERWFAAQPGIPLVNTYGLTETSDDAVHEVMHRVPDGERIPLGRPIINVHVDVVDEHGRPVPLGAPGLIVFSGVCVGRGYVNDPERTARSFGPDPNRPGSRVCRTGDYGRWLPDWKLDFLGRRDDQVKIRGFRIEIGEIENALLRADGVRDGAVVVADGADRSRHLVAFYTGPGPLPADVLRSALAATLPEYMLPSTFSWRETLPLTGNGKIDRTTLTALAADLDPLEKEFAAPATPTERRLVAAWAAVLGIPEDRIGRRDSFLDLGGTSLSAVKLAVALDRAVTPTDVAGRPVLADLAELLDGRT
ncbi:MAG TPA: amino acid adenylation domain-containing protein [Blastococcus sp.]|nr:amino acid adenylation domain-containing protein [Blastococcus sp.]